MAIKAIINNTEKEIEQIKNSDEQDIDYVYSRIGDTEVEGEPPISIKSIGGNLADYRIYGQSSRNLFDFSTATRGYRITWATGALASDETAIMSDYIPISEGIYRANASFNLIGYDTNKNYIGTYNPNTRSFAKEYGSKTSYYIIANPDVKFVKLLSYSNTDTLGDNTMFCAGSTALPYEPYGELVGDLVAEGEHAGEYKVTVTISNGNDTQIVPIYLPEQIRKVGDEAEYIDYSQQKQHRVRKNLLPNTATSQTINGVTFTVNSDGSVTCNGTASATIDYRMVALNSYSLPAGNYRLTGAPPTANFSSYYLRAWDNSSGSVKGVIDIGNGANFSLTDTTILLCAIIIASQQVFNNVTFYPMIRKADISDDTYEPYIENTDVDVTLPALSTIKGTNILSVNTSIQPSNIYIKDSFDYKKVFTATRTIEDELPLNYRNIEDNDSTLDNYRIYGNTVGGESVGDLVESGEHAGEYNIPVTVEGKNLFDEEYEDANVHYVPIKVEDGEYTLSTTIPNAGAPGGSPAANIFLLAGNVNSGASSTGNGCWLDNPKTVQSIDGYVTIAYKATESFGERCYPWNNKTMLNSGSTPLPYEPYHAPVTTPIYLPEQIRKVGDEAEYISYAEQKMHRIGADDIDVTLPALPTIKGTNEMSVGTAVQPSEVYVKGKIKEIN